ncbi:hypothetical protein PRUB_b1495 [Pseudoalteromonas rubra]|uniref:Uncharacterized protein n=1 Tax=Pseudoalteromonas rubra TaxID=43658 RepID=A0A8T0C4D1_9GAMM|nr:hypothetical protein PRUB_b1495 [Pseudoalteromonas rubra]
MLFLPPEKDKLVRHIITRTNPFPPTKGINNTRVKEHIINLGSKYSSLTISHIVSLES